MFLTGLEVLAQFRIGLLDVVDTWRLSQLAYPLGVSTMPGTVICSKRERYSWLGTWGSLGIVGAVYAAGGITPTELIKVLVVIFYGILLALLLRQRYLGMEAILEGLLVVLLIASIRRWRYIAVSLLLGAAARGHCLFLVPSQPTAISRLSVPYQTGASWQLLQGLSAIFSGGLCGTGFVGGQSQTHPHCRIQLYLRRSRGRIRLHRLLVGSFLFLAFFRRAFRGSSLAADPYSALLSLGFASFIALQTFLNICNVTKTIPLTGIPPSLYQSRR